MVASAGKPSSGAGDTPGGGSFAAILALMTGAGSGASPPAPTTGEPVLPQTMPDTDADPTAADAAGADPAVPAPAVVAPIAVAASVAGTDGAVAADGMASATSPIAGLAASITAGIEAADAPPGQATTRPPAAAAAAGLDTVPEGDGLDPNFAILAKPVAASPQAGQTAGTATPPAPLSPATPPTSAATSLIAAQVTVAADSSGPSAAQPINPDGRQAAQVAAPAQQTVAPAMILQAAVQPPRQSGAKDAPAQPTAPDPADPRAAPADKAEARQAAAPVATVAAAGVQPEVQTAAAVVLKQGHKPDAAIDIPDGSPDPLLLPAQQAALTGGPSAIAGTAAAASTVAARLGDAIASGVAAGKKRLEIRLDPPELGRVDVHLRFSGDSVQARLVVEHQDTFDLLQRDARALERALQNAGVRTDGGIDISLRDQNAGGQFHDRQGFAYRQPAENRSGATAAIDPIALTAEPPAWQRSPASGRLDLMV